MPRIVDREARRREITESYLDLVAREGMDAATTRRLASELGVATGALWHYFANFDELIARAFETVASRTDARIAAHVGDATGLIALSRMIEQIHPMDKLTRDEAAVVVGYWGRASTHRDGTAGRNAADSSWPARYRAHLQRAVADAELTPDTPTDDLGDALHAIGLGMQVSSVLHADAAEPAAQWRAVDAVLRPWLTDAGRDRLIEARAPRGR